MKSILKQSPVTRSLVQAARMGFVESVFSLYFRTILSFLLVPYRTCSVDGRSPCDALDSIQIMRHFAGLLLVLESLPSSIN